MKRTVWHWVWELMSSDPTDPDSSLLNLSSDSIEVLVLAAGAGSRSSSASSAGHRVSRKTLKDRQGKPLAIKDSKGRTLVPMNAVQRRSKDLEMGPSAAGSPGP